MDKYGPLSPDDGAELRETSDMVSKSARRKMTSLTPFAEMTFKEKAESEADEDYACGNLPEDSSSEDTIEVSKPRNLLYYMKIDQSISPKHENEPRIMIRKLSSYEDGKISATPQALSLKPGSHLTEEGSDHRISASFVARVSGLDVQTVLAWARTEPYFLKLEYSFTGHDLPRFTSRALVVEDQDEEISLSGGLGSAIRILKYVKTLESGTTNGTQRGHFPPLRRKRLLDQLRAANRIPSKTGSPRSRHPTPTSRDMERPTRLPQHQGGSIQFQPPLGPLSRSLPSLQDLDDQMSMCTDYTEDSMGTPPLTLATTETNWLGRHSEPFGVFNGSSESFLEADIPLFRGNNEWTACCAKGQQLPHEIFEQLKRKARAMYTHNGDTSGMVFLMTLAATAPFDNFPHAFWNGT